MTGILLLFSSLTSLTASHNLFSRLDAGHLPVTLTELTLEDNDFHAISDLLPLAKLPNLKRLVLKNNVISAISDPSSNVLGPGDQSLVFSHTLTDLDLSHNSVSAWSFINTLPITFP